MDRIAVAGRYAPEFDAIGNDRSAMNQLARRTGGAVIDPAQTSPSSFIGPLGASRSLLPVGDGRIHLSA